MSSAIRNRVREAALAKWLNLITPGAGLVLVDRWLDGLLLAGSFALSAGGLLIATVVAPHSYGAAFRALAAVAMVATYGLAQLAMERAAAGRGRSDAASERRGLLERANRSSRYGDYAGAIAQLQEAIERSPMDLSLQAEIAALYDRAGDLQAAQAAWRRVRAIDRHRIYKAQIEAAERRAAEAAAMVGRDDEPRSEG